MSTPRKPGYGGVEFIGADESAVTTSGSGMTERKRRAPIPDARAAGKLDIESEIAPAEEWALDLLRLEGKKSDGKVRGKTDTPENFAQRFLDYARSIRDSIKRGDSAGAAAQAFVLAGFIRDLQTLKNYSEKQAEIARNPRPRIVAGNDEKTGLPQIIRRLSVKVVGDNDQRTPQELWPELFDELDRLELKPVEKDDTYSFLGGSIKKTSFEVMLSRIRNPSKD